MCKIACKITNGNFKTKKLDAKNLIAFLLSRQ